MSRDASGALSSRPIFTRYSGVTDSAIVSPIASWKPSLALSRKSDRLILVGALVEVVPELVVDRREVLGRLLDAHLDADVVVEVDVPRARVADDLAILRPRRRASAPRTSSAAARSRATCRSARRSRTMSSARHLALLQDVGQRVARRRRWPARPAGRCSTSPAPRCCRAGAPESDRSPGTTSPYFSRSFMRT